MLIGVGENPLKLDHLFICVEGDKLVDVSSYSSDTVLLCFYAIYYIFSIAYPVDHKDFFYFVDSVIAGLQTSDVVKRITVQKCTKELSAFIPA